MIKKSLLSILFAGSLLNAVTLEEKIGQMFMVGFFGTSASKNSQICQDIKKYHLGGVILFDHNPVDKNRPKNIINKKQLKELTGELQSCSNDRKLFIAVDQEGGRVQRLKSKYGFSGKFPKASDIKDMNLGKIREIYTLMGQELKSVGINYNLAPVVDLDINKKNHVIHGLGRSFGSNPKTVAGYASIFIDSMHSSGVLTSVKHFPGHGSSVGDTHKGFVDVTHLWKKIELEPYRLLKDKADTVMAAHVFNRKLDSRYPASLSRRTITEILRGRLGYNGVVITDDLQMGAIAKKYSLKETLQLAINAGNDILLIGNQLDPKRIQNIGNLVKSVKLLVKSGKISQESINSSYRRIEKLKNRL